MFGLLFLGVLTASQVCNALLYSTFYSVTPLTTPLLGRQMSSALFYRSGNDAQRSEALLPVNSKADERLGLLTSSPHFAPSFPRSNLTWKKQWTQTSSPEVCFSRTSHPRHNPNIPILTQELA